MFEKLFSLFKKKESFEDRRWGQLNNIQQDYQSALYQNYSPRNSIPFDNKQQGSYPLLAKLQNKSCQYKSEN